MDNQLVHNAYENARFVKITGIRHNPHCKHLAKYVGRIGMIEGNAFHGFKIVFMVDGVKEVVDQVNLSHALSVSKQALIELGEDAFKACNQ